MAAVTGAAFPIWLILMGPVLASFLTALAERLCAGGARPGARSRCSACGGALAARDLVPLLSWPLLGGRCRSCRARIPVRLWLAEIAGLGLAVLALATGTSPAGQMLGALYLLLLLGLFQTDLLCLRLPDALTAPLLAAGLGLGILSEGLAATLLAVAIGAGGLWMIATLYARGRGRVGLGAGDVKMMAGLSAAVGPASVPWITLVAAGTALVWAVVEAGGVRRLSGGNRLAFGCHLAVAGGLVWLWGQA